MRIQFIAAQDQARRHSIGCATGEIGNKSLGTWVTLGDAMETLSTAKDIIAEEFRRGGFNALQILLFGSRARGDFDNRSDWDFFVTADKELAFNERREIAGRIRWRLARAGLASDVIIRSASAVSKAQKNTGCLAYYVFKEGIEL